jgi:hypothetical protein
MGRHTFWIGVCAAAALAGAAGAEPDPAAAPIQLTVELSDGCRLVGVPAQTSVPMISLIGKIDVPLAQVKTMTFQDDHEGVVVALINGDRLTGVQSLDELRMKTLYGDVAIKPALIRKIECRAGYGSTKLPANLSKGLVLRYTFDALQEGVVKDASDCKNHSAVVRGVTVAGQASFQGTTSIAVPNSASLNPEKSITLSVWIKATTHENKGIVMKGPLTDSQGSYSLVLNPDAAGGHALFRLNGGTADGQGQVSTRESMDDYLGKWTHLAGTYADGEQRIYVNGRLSGTQPYRQPIRNDASALVVGGYYSAGHLYQGDLDDLMIFNRALTGAEIEQLYQLRK